MNGLLQNAFEAKDRFISELQTELSEKKAINAELLEALKELTLAYQRTAQYRCLDEVKEDEQRFMNAKATIAKAEGKQ